MSEEEPLLLQCFHVHSNQYSSGGEDNNVLMGETGPLEVKARLRRVAYDVLKLHNWIDVHLGASLHLLPDVLTSLVGHSFIRMKRDSPRNKAVFVPWIRFVKAKAHL